MNRDLLAQSQPEVRAMMDGILRWHPQVFVDHHSTTSSFFFPPVAQAVNMNLPPQTTKWFATYGRATPPRSTATAGSITWAGVRLFLRRLLGRMDHVSGRLRMTYETDGGPEFRKRRDDGSITTFLDGIAHHFVRPWPHWKRRPRTGRAGCRTTMIPPLGDGGSGDRSH